MGKNNLIRAFVICAAFIVVALFAYFILFHIDNTVKKKAIAQAEKMDFSQTEKTNGYETESASYHYLDSDGEYSFYSVLQLEKDSDGDSYFDIRKKRTLICKIKDNTVVEKFDTASLSVGENDDVYIPHGAYHNGFLFFTVQNKKGIYRIDSSLKHCELYIQKSKYGEISKSTVSFYNNALVFITNDNQVVLYDGKDEKLLCKADALEKNFSSDEKFEPRGYDLDYNAFVQSNYIVCTNGSETYFAAKNKIFLKSKSADFKEIKTIHIKHDLGTSCILGIDFCQSDKKYLKILCRCVTDETANFSFENRVYILDPETGKMKCFQQKNRIKSIIWLL